jgi:N6-L-threonylcarbamoyladenine synthase
MKILAIETSCDDTGVTILEAKGKNSFRVLADELAIQSKLHEKFGGVYPNLAKNEHIKNLPLLARKAFDKAKIKKADAIFVTAGPGLEPCLWTGITFAENLGRLWKVPVVPVNHMEGHIISVFGKNKGSFKIPSTKFPVLSLLVSGGHTELVLSKNWLSHKIIGKTLDDAAGEAFDKVARMLGLPYPGGPHISKLAEETRTLHKNSGFVFPRPMIKSKDFNFSYAGLKTSVLYFIQKNPKASKSEIALEFENAVVETLVSKTKKAVEKFKIKTLIVGGGVAANKHLRRELTRVLPQVKILFPTPELARDNAIMIGMAGYLRYRENPKKKYKIKAKGGLAL